jgi:hypothetical protein
MNDVAMRDQEYAFVLGSLSCKWSDYRDGDRYCKETKDSSGTCSKETCPIMLEVVHEGREKRK